MTEEYSRCYPDVNSSGYRTRRYNLGYMATSFGSRVKKRREELGMTQPELAKAAGIKQPTVSNIESGRNKGSSYVVQLATALKCSPHWLATGRGPKEPHDNEPGPSIRARVPLISWTTAGRWGEVQDPFSPGDAEEWISTTATVGPSSFALRIRGDSMEPKIPDGAIVIIDPAAPYSHGKIVLAKRTQDQEATLKQLWYDGAVPKLRPLNGRYPILEMPEDTRILGVAVKLELDL